MKKTKKILLQVIVLIISTQVYFGQIIPIPKSFRFKSGLDSIPEINIAQPYQIQALNNERLQFYADSITQSCESCGGDYYGYGIQGNINIKSNAQFIDQNIDGGKLYIFKMTSATAMGFQFYFNQFIIPVGASLFIYNGDKSRILGPYTNKNTPQNILDLIHFGSPPIYGNTVYFEYFEDNNSIGNVEITNTIHLFRSNGGLHPDIGASLPCSKDLSCPEGNGWEKEANSVAAIWYYNPSYMLAARCTGALLNNTKQDGTPYFLTAGHCYNTFDPGNNMYNYMTWQFAFRYHVKTCGQQDLADFHVIYGSSLLSQDAQYLPPNQNSPSQATSDYLLLKLNTDVYELTEAGACYSGWTLNNPIVYPSVSYGLIHHPKGDVKKITYGSNLANATMLNSSHYYLLTHTPNKGTTQPGSSGAPLYNSLHQIIGTVKGPLIITPSGDYCNSEHYKTHLGKFSWHWSQGNFKQWLDPLNQTNNASFGVSTYCPYKPGAVVGLGGPIEVGTSQGLNIVCDEVKKGLAAEGKPGPSAILCAPAGPNFLIKVTPKKGDYFCGFRGVWEEVDCDDAEDGSGGLVGDCEGKARFFGSGYRHCKCRATYIQTFLTELDYNLNPIGNVGTKTHKSFGLNTLLPSIKPSDYGITLTPGKWYNIGVGHNHQVNGWQYSSINVFIMPQTGNFNNLSISTSLYAASDVYLQNVTVNTNNPQLKVASPTLINVTGNSSLKVGRYYTNAGMNCNNISARSAVTQNNADENNNSYEEQIYSNPDNLALITYSENFKIYPVPSSSNILVEFTGEDLLKKNILISVYDLFGKEIINTTIYNLNNTIDIDISHLNNGLYALRATVDEKNYNSKFIKN